MNVIDLMLSGLAAILYWPFTSLYSITFSAIQIQRRGHERYAVIIILAAVPTALAMALMRYGFRNPIEQDDDPSPVTAIQSLLSEILGIVRAYFESRPH